MFLEFHFNISTAIEMRLAHHERLCHHQKRRGALRLELKSSQIVWLLGVSQIIGYGTLYYSFSILADDIAKSFSWPVSWVYGSFSLALLAGGVTLRSWGGALIGMAQRR
jgi:hypothetical protein